jgi:hypothetical protein
MLLLTYYHTTMTKKDSIKHFRSLDPVMLLFSHNSIRLCKNPLSDIGHRALHTYAQIVLPHFGINP